MGAASSRLARRGRRARGTRRRRPRPRAFAARLPRGIHGVAAAGPRGVRHDDEPPVGEPLASGNGATSSATRGGSSCLSRWCRAGSSESCRSRRTARSTRSDLAFLNAAAIQLAIALDRHSHLQHEKLLRERARDPRASEDSAPRPGEASPRRGRARGATARVPCRGERPNHGLPRSPDDARRSRAPRASAPRRLGVGRRGEPRRRRSTRVAVTEPALREARRRAGGSPRPRARRALWAGQGAGDATTRDRQRRHRTLHCGPRSARRSSRARPTPRRERVPDRPSSPRQGRGSAAITFGCEPRVSTTSTTSCSPSSSAPRRPRPPERSALRERPSCHPHARRLPRHRLPRPQEPLSAIGLSAGVLARTAPQGEAGDANRARAETVGRVARAAWIASSRTSSM